MSLIAFYTMLISPPDMLVDVLRVISSLGLVVVMFNLGLKIKFIQIKKIFSKPKNLFIGLVCQIILIPIIGIVFISTFDFSTNILVAIMIIACMPSAATSNYICSKINGDLSLSITLTSICTISAVYTVPFFFKIFSLLTTKDIFFFNFNYTDIIMKIFLIVTVPILIGMMLKYYLPLIKKIEKNLDYICLILFFIIIALAVYLSAINIKNPTESFTAILTFMSIILFTIFIVTKITHTSFEVTKTIFAEGLLQNNVLGFLIVYSFGGGYASLISIIAIYAVCQYLIFMVLMFTLLKNKSST